MKLNRPGRWVVFVSVVSLLIGGLLGPYPAKLSAANPALVSGQAAMNHSFGGNISAAYPHSNSSGDLLVAAVFVNSTSGSVTVDDSNGNGSYQTAMSRADSSFTGSKMYIFYIKNSKAGANTVTAHVTGGSSNSLYIS